MMDKRGIGLFLFLSFGLTALAVGLALKSGYLDAMPDSSRAFLVLIGLTWIPGFAAFATSFGSPVSAGRAWPISVPYGLGAALGVPAAFVLIFALIKAVGIAAPDWNIREIMVMLPPAEELNFTSPISPVLVLALGFGAMLIGGPTVGALALLGNEYAWRGFMLSRLAPLGRVSASVLGSLIWTVWAAIPVCGVGYSQGVSVAGQLRGLAVVFVFGVLLGEIWRRSRNFGLTSIAIGAFAVQFSGMWDALFPNDRLPWGGTTGWVAIAVWVVLALALKMAGARRAECDERIGGMAAEQG